MKNRKQLRFFAIIALCIVFVVSSVLAIQLITQSQKEQRAFEELASFIKGKNTQNNTSDEPTFLQKNESSVEDYHSPYSFFKEQNEDFLGWISIEGTKINYPVMYTPSDPEYYLRRAFDGSDSQSGVPFLDAQCTDGCGNYLIYGHNMKNGTMFSSLLSYSEQKFWKAHPVIQFDTLTESGTYEIIAAFYSKVYQEGEPGFRYYRYTDLRDRTVFEEYLEEVINSSLYPTEIKTEYGDQLLTFSTCSYHTDGGRFVVVARKEGA